MWLELALHPPLPTPLCLLPVWLRAQSRGRPERSGGRQGGLSWAAFKRFFTSDCPSLPSAWLPGCPVGVAQIPQQISDTCVLFSLLPKSAAKEKQNKRGAGGTIIRGNKRQTHDTSRCICWSSQKGACASGRGIWLLICTAFCSMLYGLWCFLPCGLCFISVAVFVFGSLRN